MSEATPSPDNGIIVQLPKAEIRKSSLRQTPLTSFGEQLKSGMVATTRVVRNVASSAGYMIPGAAVVSAAITGVGAVKDSGTATGAPGMHSTSGMLDDSGNLLSGKTLVGDSSSWSGGPLSGEPLGGGYGGYMGNIQGRADKGDPSAQMMMATHQMQEMNQQFNVQYLILQQNVQQENRKFSTLSNVMKTKHDTAKNTMSNLK